LIKFIVQLIDCVIIDSKATCERNFSACLKLVSNYRLRWRWIEFLSIKAKFTKLEVD